MSLRLPGMSERTPVRTACCATHEYRSSGITKRVDLEDDFAPVNRLQERVPDTFISRKMSVPFAATVNRCAR